MWRGTMSTSTPPRARARDARLRPAFTLCRFGKLRARSPSCFRKSRSPRASAAARLCPAGRAPRPSSRGRRRDRPGPGPTPEFDRDRPRIPRGCAVFARARCCTSSTRVDSIGTVFRGLLGVATGPEAEAYDRAQVLAGEIVAARPPRRRRREVGPSRGVARMRRRRERVGRESFRGGGGGGGAVTLSPVDGDSKAATLSGALGADFGATSRDAARRAVARGDARRARRLVARAGDRSGAIRRVMSA